MEREPGSARMVTTGCVHEEYVGRLAEAAHSVFEQPAFAQREQARLVRRARLTRDDGMRTDPALVHDDGGGRPARIAGLSRTRLPADEADEAAAHNGLALRPPQSRRLAGELLLLRHQLRRS
jgi:hypothetical protein